MKPSILIAGIGNIFYGDDAFGSEVARRLLARAWPDNVRVADYGIRGLDLTFALLDGYDTVILLDAAPRGGAPGTLYTMEPDLSVLDRGDGKEGALETHGMDPVRVLVAARSMGAKWGRILVVGCEPSPETIDPEEEGRIGLSQPVRDAVEEACRLIEDLVTKMTAAAPHAAITGG
ncbi:MAG TPA: hydrogenase maturation protease [Bryobacteraceae bacterium]|nr:hydrogenase maturation protease [Bryobacteraceae bacterium]